MSSILRVPAQTPSRTIWNYNGGYIATESRLTVWAQENNVKVNGNMYILNMNDSDFGVAIKDLFNYDMIKTSSYTSVLDLGKKIYIGMATGTGSELAGESRIATLNLVKILTGDYQGLTGYIVIEANCNELIAGDAEGYLNILVSRGAA